MASNTVATLALEALAPLWQSCAQQDYPRACLYMVATPIGNIADISLRALQVLHMVDIVACEDTRHTRSLLQRLGLGHAQPTLQAVHQHNEATQAQALLLALQSGARVAYVSDAGTPGISDPGARLVATLQAAGLRILPIPGASALTALCSASAGVDERGLRFIGFVPATAAALHTCLRSIALSPEAVVLYEAPHRIHALALALAQEPLLAQRYITIGRELTKQYETIITLPCNAFSAWLAADAARQKGEFCLLLHAESQDQRTHKEVQLGPEIEHALQQLRAADFSVRGAVDLVCSLQPRTPKKAVYAKALQLWQSA